MNKNLLLLIVFTIVFVRDSIAGKIILRRSPIELTDTLAKTDTATGQALFKPFKGIRWNGYVRTFFYYRNLSDKYSNLSGGSSTGNEWYSVNGGYNEPFMRLTASGNPAENLYLDVEYTFDNLLTGQGLLGDRGRTNLPLQGLRFGGSYNTPVGKYTVMAGGIYWYNITPLTFGGYNTRYDPFERVAWESDGSSWKRYSTFFENGGVATAGAGNRFGSAATQGFVIQGNDLPNGFGFAAVYGKTINSGGYQAWQARSPKKVAVYRLTKKINNHFVGVNYYNSFGNINQTSGTDEILNLITSDFKIRLGEVSLTGEIGTGSYENPTYSKKTGEVANISIKTSEKLSFIPVALQLYSVSPNVVNPNSEMVNSSISSISNVYGNTTNGLYVNKGAVTDIGQITNNRKGMNLFLYKNTSKIRVALSVGTSQEYNNLYDVITFQHRLNKVQRSKFNFFANATGPYKKLYSQYLTVFETTTILPEYGGTTLGYKKSFNSLDLSLRYKFWFLNKEIILSNYFNYNTVQKQFSALPLGKEPFVKLFYEELTMYYGLNAKTTLVGMLGFERNKGSMETELAYAQDGTITYKDPISKKTITTKVSKGQLITDPVTGISKYNPDGRPMDQIGYGIGIGVDYNINDRCGLYLRERWFSHQDRSFILDKFTGYDTSVEFKVFF